MLRIDIAFYFGESETKKLFPLCRFVALPECDERKYTR
jgi:hypothetical protein